MFFAFEFYPTDHYNHKPYWKYIETEYIPTLIKNYAQNGQIYTYVYGHGWMHAILLEACGYDPDDYNPEYFEGPIMIDTKCLKTFAKKVEDFLLNRFGYFGPAVYYVGTVSNTTSYSKDGEFLAGGTFIYDILYEHGDDFLHFLDKQEYVSLLIHSHLYQKGTINVTRYEEIIAFSRVPLEEEELEEILDRVERAFFR